MNPQPRELIVNADDFGMSVGINEGIVDAHINGILTSASLMVRRPAAEHAITIAKSHPELSIGLHLDLCEWVYEQDEWQLSYEVVSLSDERAIKNEVQRQLETFGSLVGKSPSHIDSHQHVHRSDPIRSIVLAEARRLDIPVREETPGILYCGRFYGQTNKGQPYPDGISVSALASILKGLPSGIVELACHPARFDDFQSVYAEERVREYEVLCDPFVKATVTHGGIRLTNFNGRKLRR
jgi:predicted glycoside hydrolase/deacetylase ChbG (UPF0249 family)